MNSAAYQPVQGGLGVSNGDDDEDGGDNDGDAFRDEDYDSSRMTNNNNNNTSRTTTRIEPLEMGSTSFGEGDDADGRHNRPSSPTDVAVVWPHIALSVTCWLVVPSLVAGCIMAYALMGRIWTCLLFSLHLTLSLIKACWHVSELATFALNTKDNRTNYPIRAKRPTGMPYRDADDDDDNTGGEIGDNNATEEASTTWEPPSDASSSNTDDDDDDGLSRNGPHANSNNYQGTTYFWVTSLPSLMDIVLFGGIYPLIISAFYNFFVDADGTVIAEWFYFHRGFRIVTFTGWMIVVLRVCIGGRVLLSRVPASTYYLTTCYYMIQPLPVLGACLRFYHYKVWLRFKACFSTPPKPLACWQSMTSISVGGSALFLGWTIYSLIVHFGPFEPVQPHHDPLMCDPLDKTECILPFPSFYHLKRDNSTETGYRVNLKPESFPTLKGRIPIPVDFLNSLDGFSTMGPLLFYMDGLKESHQHYLKSVRHDSSLTIQQGVTRLRGHQQIELSVTPFSTTLLMDVTSQELVAHSAEIDYLDPERPLVLIFPAQPLKHNTQYALAVVNATDAKGNRLPPSPGMLDILDEDSPNDPASRKHLFQNVILPALEGATHKVSAKDTSGSHDWGGPFGAFIRSHDPPALQLLFDFQTASKESQLGPARKVRDHTLRNIMAKWSNNWAGHVRVIRQIDGDCKDNSYPLARTIHAEMDVPWFLTGFGPGYRDATLDPESLKTAVPTTLGKAKFVVHVPCSLREAAIRIPTTNRTARSLRAVIEFGHGLFGDRAEAGDGFLIRMANRNGYIITAMDWRGMSKYDFPVVARTMLTDPSLFEAVRDNLIQGYANKFALQHFIHNGMLDMKFLKFAKPGAAGGKNYLLTIPRYKQSANSTVPEPQGGIPSMFYGISQGGILGAGYLGLSGNTGLISRGALGVPGTPFSLVLSRSLQFNGYDIALLLNFYNNRHVRIFLSLAQMCWDSVEAAGVLGQPVEEPVPRILMQAGLGDPIVPTLAAERLARALGAQILPHNPRRPIFGIPVGEPSSDQQAVLTEILYQKEYDSLPVSDKLTAHDNDVHNCVRLEPVLIAQIEEFFNSGRITDPCAAANGTACKRRKAKCFNHSTA